MTNKANDLLQEVIDFRQGKNKYDFSGKYGADKENSIFDAWADIESRIIIHLKDSKSANTKKNNPIK